MSLSPPEYIRHILYEIDYILNRISDMDYESFVRDETLKRAFVRSIEVIGEALKKNCQKISHKDLTDMPNKKTQINSEFDGRSDSIHCSGSPANWHESFYRGNA